MSSLKLLSIVVKIVVFVVSFEPVVVIVKWIIVKITAFVVKYHENWVHDIKNCVDFVNPRIMFMNH